MQTVTPVTLNVYSLLANVFVKSAPGPNVIKLFTSVIYKFSQYARVFVSGKPFQPSLMFVRKVGAYPSGVSKRSSHFRVDS